MIGSVWLISALLSFIPIFTNLFTTKEHARVIDNLKYEDGICEFKVNFHYRIVSSLISFWLPGVGMVVFYCLLMRKAYHFAKKDIAFRRKSRVMSIIEAPNIENFDIRSSDGTEMESFVKKAKRKVSTNVQNVVKKIDKTEYRALKTFGTIMGVFCLCWFFFFLNYTICNDEILPCEKYIGRANYIIIVDILFWIGYFNSMVNPFLYNFTNKDFQRAFRSLLGVKNADNTNILLKLCCSSKQKKNSISSNYNSKKRSSRNDSIVSNALHSNKDAQ